MKRFFADEVEQQKFNDAIKEKYSVANIYLISVLSGIISNHLEEIVAPNAPGEAFIDTNNLQELQDMSINGDVEKVYILFSRSSNQLFIHGSTVKYEDLVVDYTEHGVEIYNPSLKAQLDKEVALRKSFSSTELFEEAGKFSLNDLASLSHRVCMVVNLKERRIDFKDSFGDEIQPALKAAVCKKFSIPESAVVCDRQEQQHRDDHCNCGLLSLENLLRLKNNLPPLDLDANYMSTIQSIRKKYGDRFQQEIMQCIQQLRQLQDPEPSSTPLSMQPM